MSDIFEYNDDVVRLCTRIRALISESHKTVLLTGVTESDPVAQIAYELARTLVLLGDGPVLLVDANFSRATKHMDGSQSISGPGLLDVLRHESPLAEAIAGDKLPGLFYLDSGSAVGDYHALLLSDQCGELLKEMRQDFAYVIIESAAIMVHSECLRLAGRVDGVAVVVEAGEHQQSELANLKEMMDAFRLPVLGIIFSSKPSKLRMR